MYNYKIIIISLLILISFTSVFSENIKNERLISIILPFTSAFKGIADEQQNAINLYLEDHEEYDVIFMDSKNDAEGAIVAFKELMNMDYPPFAAITCASWVATALHPLTAQNGVFHIVIASANFKRTLPHHTIRFTLDGSQEERQLANYLNEFNDISILYMDNSYGTVWKTNIMNNLGEKVVQSIAYDPLEKDFTAKLERIKKSVPEALVLLSAGNAAIIAKEARMMGIESQFVGTRPIERPELLDEAKYTNGLVYTYPSYNQDHPMIDKYAEKYGTKPTIFGIEAYEAIHSLFKASEETDQSPDKLFDWFANRILYGALGEVHFDKIGDAHYPYMYKQIQNGKFVTAKFQYELLLQNAKQEIQQTFEDMDKVVKQTAENLANLGLEGDAVNKELEYLYNNTKYSYDIVTIDKSGIIRNVFPKKYTEIIGSDISKQPQIIQLLETHKPVVSEAIETVEGFTGFDMEYPVFDENNDFIGSVSILTQPDFFGQIISQKVFNFPVEIWIMQKDGKIVYDVNNEEIGLNIFEDEIFAPYKSLLEIAEQMKVLKSGEGEYTFLDSKMEKSIIKKLIWTTVYMYGTEFRLALSHVNDEY